MHSDERAQFGRIGSSEVNVQMTKRQRLLVAAVAGSFGLALFASQSFASGPLMLGPAPMTAPKVHVTSSLTHVKAQVLNAYRQVRTFWISRAIVR